VVDPLGPGGAHPDPQRTERKERQESHTQK
jgi:hypothetical protein